MNTNYNFQQPSPCLLRCLSVICLLTFPLVGLSGANAQTAIRATSTNRNSQLLRANGKIAFTSDRDGNREIYVMNNDGTGQVRLTTNPVRDDYPAWSPDGRQIAFLSGNSLKLMNADGTNQTQLTTVAVEQNCAYGFGLSCGLSWSPDGTKIAFTDFADIVVINIDGSKRVNLTNDSAIDVHPSWSPDGSRIAFARNSSSPFIYFNIYTMNADGTNLTLFKGSGSRGNLGEIDPAWSPDGNRIAAVLNRSPVDSSDLLVMNTDGTGYTIDFVIERDHASPAWSPDGTKIAFGGVVDPYVQYINSEIFVINADGSGITQLTNTPGYEGHPAWQPLSPSACTNPIDCADFFVRQHYGDFLNREPDQGGLDYWTNQILQCGSDARCIHERRIGVSAAFFVEAEFQQTGYVVYRLHRAAYGTMLNAPSRANLTFAQFMADRTRLAEGPGLESTRSFADAFVSRPEFKQAYPDSMSPTIFVNTLFDTASLIPFTAERQSALNALANGTQTRARVLLDVIEIQALKDREYNSAFVLMQYFGYLRRDPDQGGYDFWLDVLNNREPNNFHGMVCAFLTSAEYQLRFATGVTRTNRDCVE